MQLDSYWTWAFYLASHPHISFLTFWQGRISSNPYSYPHRRKTRPFQVLPAWAGPSFSMALPLRTRCCLHLLNPMLADLGKTLHFPSWTRILCISPSGQAAHPLPHPSSAMQHLLSPEDPAPALLPSPRWYAVMGGGGQPCCYHAHGEQMPSHKHMQASPCIPHMLLTSAPPLFWHAVGPLFSSSPRGRGGAGGEGTFLPADITLQDEASS